MKRFTSTFLALLLLLTCVFTCGVSFGASAAKAESKRVIAMVFDNSGTMFIGETDESNKTWCRATYSVQALATMMNPSDVMYIYPMNPIQIGTSENPTETYTMDKPMEITQKDAAKIREIYTPQLSEDQLFNTHIEAVEKAVAGLKAASGDVKWLVIPTDGTVFYRNQDEVIENSKEELSKLFQQVDTMYLGIGKDGEPDFKTDGTHQFVARWAKNSAEVLKHLTEMGNLMFGRDELPSVAENVTFDVSMKKLILFVQGNEIDNVKLGNLTPISVDKLAYSTYGAEKYLKRQACDTSLQGTMLTFENVDIGSYKLSFSGQASSTAVYYEPDADLQFIFTDAVGNTVDPNALYEGDYIVSYGLKDRKTGKLIKSDLLGDPQYRGSYTLNGKEYPITHDGQNGEVKVTLNMGDTFEAKMTVTYLSGYTITKDSSDFGWPKGGVTVAARPAGDLRLEIAGGDAVYPLQTLEEGSPFTIKVFYKDEQLTGDALKSVTLNLGDSNAGIEGPTFADDHYVVKLCYKDPASPKDTVCGECKVTVGAKYTAKGSEEATAVGAFKYTIDEDEGLLKMEMSAPQDYVVISEMSESQPMTVTLTIEGKPLTPEQFASTVLQVDCGGIKHTVTPREQDSSYVIQLLPTDGIDEGNYPITVKAVYTDKIGRAYEAENGARITLSTMPLWLKWVIGISLLLLFIILLYLILHIRVPPKHVRKETDSCSLSVGGRDVTNDANFEARSSGKQIVAYVEYGGEELGRVILNKLAPGKESYLYKTSPKRNFWAKFPESATVTGEVTAFDVAGVDYIVDKEGNVVPADEQQAAYMITNGASITINGRTMIAGRTKNFSADIPLNFKK